jgi:hypothetical protein
MRKETGGPAFPVTGHIELEWGMTLRDYFAAKSMQGLIAAGKSIPWIEIAGVAYDMADAMLEARK